MKEKFDFLKEINIERLLAKLTKRNRHSGRGQESLLTLHSWDMVSPLQKAKYLGSSADHRRQCVAGCAHLYKLLPLETLPTL